MKPLLRTVLERRMAAPIRRPARTIEGLPLFRMERARQGQEGRTMALKTLAEYQEEKARERRQREWEEANGTPFGVACPMCGTELRMLRGSLLMTYPPKRRTKCTHCGYTGTVTA